MLWLYFDISGVLSNLFKAYRPKFVSRVLVVRCNFAALADQLSVAKSFCAKDNCFEIVLASITREMCAARRIALRNIPHFFAGKIAYCSGWVVLNSWILHMA